MLATGQSQSPTTATEKSHGTSWKWVAYSAVVTAALLAVLLNEGGRAFLAQAYAEPVDLQVQTVKVTAAAGVNHH